MANPARMVVVATDAATGKSVFFTKDDLRRDDYGMFAASGCLPVWCRAYHWRGGDYFDGALSDPIPLERAFADGCDRCIVLLTRPPEFRKQTKNAAAFKTLRRKWPNMVEKLYARCDLYNRKLEAALADPRVFVVGPDDVCGVDTLKRKKDDLDRLYYKGYADGKKVRDYLRTLED